MVYGGGNRTMRRFLKLYTVEQKLAFRSIDSIIFGVIMPIGILFLISIIAGGKMAGDSGYTYLEKFMPELKRV